MRKRWTPDDDASLRAFVAQGLTAAEIGRLLGRSEQAIALRKIRLGLRARQFVSQETIDRAYRLIDGGMSSGKAARECGMTDNALDYYRRRDGIVTATSEPRPNGGDWDGVLVEMDIAGLSHAEIGRRVGRTAGSVRNRLRTLAYRQVIEEDGRPRRMPPAPGPVNRTPKGLKGAVLDALRCAAAPIPGIDLARAVGVSLGREVKPIDVRAAVQRLRGDGIEIAHWPGPYGGGYIHPDREDLLYPVSVGSVMAECMALAARRELH